MPYTVIKTDPTIYSNLTKEESYAVFRDTVFNFPLNKGKFKSFGLFFKVVGKVLGDISIGIQIDNFEKVFHIPSDKISSDNPIMFPLDYTNNEDTKVRVSLAFNMASGNGSLFIRVSDSIPCIYLECDRYTSYKFKDPLVISIITPTYKTDIELLKKTSESVLNQSYEKWEWCIFDDGSGDPDLLSYLKSLKDPRIKVKIGDINKGIVSATNNALAMATGSFVGFLDHDDLLHEDALLYVALECQKYPEVDLIYTDENKVLSDGSFVGPFYKPDWNYSLLLSYMYTCHFSVYRKSIVDKIGGMRVGFEGSQDYDLVLRFIEQTKNIRHIPKILYHWRVTPNSTSSSMVNKPNARINGAMAIEDHLKRIKRPGKVLAGNFPGQYNVRYHLTEKPKVSIIIPFKDKVSLLNNLLKSFELTDYPRYEILLVDNNSEKSETKEFLAKLSTNKAIRVLQYNHEFNYSNINNYAVGLCSGSSEYLLFLNNDIEIMHPEWLYNMVQHFVRPEVAAVGAKLLYLDHKIQHAGVVVGVNGLAAHTHKKICDWEPGYFSRPHLTQDITCVTGACLMIRKKVFLDIRGFDPKLPEAFNDVDICLTIRKHGWNIVYTPYARLYHLESYTRGNDAGTKRFRDAISYMYEKWDLNNFVDPYYNPNLPDNCEGGSWV